jgi:hypothetical protein
LVAQEHVNHPPFPSLSSYDGIPPNTTYQAAALINAARNTGGSIGEVCSRRWNLRPVTILVNERPDGTHVSHGMLANLAALYDDRTPLLSRGISTRKSKTFFAKVRLTALLPADEQKH